MACYYRPNDLYYNEFTTHRFDTGAVSNADFLPTVTANKNGTDDATFILTRSNIDIGRYKITGVIPATYLVGDRVIVSANATVNGINAKAILDNFLISSTGSQLPIVGSDHLVKISTNIQDLSSTFSVNAKTVTDKTGYSITANSDKSNYGLSAGQLNSVTAISITDKTGYSVSTVLDKSNYGLSAGQLSSVTAAKINDKTGYSITANSDKSNYGLSAGQLSSVTASVIVDKTGYSITANSDKTGYQLSSLYDRAKTAARTGQKMDIIDSLKTGSYLNAQIKATDNINLSTLQKSDVRTQIDNALTASVSSFADAVWDQQLTAATHNVTTSAGRRLRQVGQYSIIEGVLPSQTGVAINAVKLPSDASSENGAYDPAQICITDGTGRGQTRMIYQYVGSTRMAYLDRDWKMQPDNTSNYQILSNSGRQQVNQGLVTAATIDTVSLNTNASNIDNNYVGQIIFIRSGTGQDQTRIIQSYTGSTKTATVSQSWSIIPSTDSCYVMLPNHVMSLTQVRNEINNSLSAYNVAKQSDLNSVTASVILDKSDYSISGTKKTLDDLNDFDFNNTSIDGMTLRHIYQLMAAMANGNFNIVNGDTITFYKRDNITPLTVVKKTSTQRNRIS